jgi:hypothetical protein
MSAAPKSAALSAPNVYSRLDRNSAAQCRIFLIEHYTCACARAHTQEPLYRNSAALCSTAALSDLALRVARLGPDHRNPEQFHMDKSEIVAELRRLARRKAVTP